MDSWEFTKIAAAILSALLLIVGSRTAIEIATSGHGGHQVAGYSLPVASAPSAGAGQPAAAAFSFAAIAPLLQKASAESGGAAFKKCAACHTVEPGAANKIGPNLHGVVGRPKGAVEGFSYSAALKSKGGEWSYDNLASFIHDPKGYAPGNKMSFAGVRDNQELADIIAYLKSISPSAPALPSG